MIVRVSSLPLLLASSNNNHSSRFFFHLLRFFFIHQALSVKDFEEVYINNIICHRLRITYFTCLNILFYNEKLKSFAIIFSLMNFFAITTWSFLQSSSKLFCKMTSLNITFILFIKVFQIFDYIIFASLFYFSVETKNIVFSLIDERFQPAMFRNSINRIIQRSQSVDLLAYSSK